MNISFIIIIIICIIELIILFYKEWYIEELNKDIKFQQDDMNVVGKVYNALGEELKNKKEELIHETKCLNRANKLLDLYRGRYGYLQYEDIKFVCEKWKAEE